MTCAASSVVYAIKIAIISPETAIINLQTLIQLVGLCMVKTTNLFLQWHSCMFISCTHVLENKCVCMHN